MNPKKIVITLFIIIALILVVVGANVIVRKHEASIDYSKMTILFYSDVCPHCAKVENYLQTNHVSLKINYEMREVTHNRDNLYDLIQMAQKCHLDTKNVAVPFLWTGQTCIVGDKPIIKYFQKKLDEKR